MPACIVTAGLNVVRTSTARGQNVSAAMRRIRDASCGMAHRTRLGARAMSVPLHQARMALQQVCLIGIGQRAAGRVDVEQRPPAIAADAAGGGDRREKSVARPATADRCAQEVAGRHTCRACRARSAARCAATPAASPARRPAPRGRLPPASHPATARLPAAEEATRFAGSVPRRTQPRQRAEPDVQPATRPATAPAPGIDPDQPAAATHAR